jgi:hypothetical protein
VWQSQRGGKIFKLVRKTTWNFINNCDFFRSSCSLSTAVIVIARPGRQKTIYRTDNILVKVRAV